MTFLHDLPKCQACGGARFMPTPAAEIHVCRGSSKQALLSTSLCESCSVRAVSAVEEMIEKVRSEIEQTGKAWL